MAQKRNIVIKTPRGSIYTVKTANGSVTAKMEWNHGFSGQKSASFGEAQEFVDSECIRRMNPETPRLSVCDTGNSDRIRRDQPDHAICTQTVL